MLLATPPIASAAFRTGLWDDWFTSTNAGLRERTFDLTKGTGVDLVRVNVRWRNFVGASPPEDPTDPSDPGYYFASLDAAVRDASARGLDVMFLLYAAPDWAEGSNRPKDFKWEGAWKPNTRALGDFGIALATRYSGTFPDPLGGYLPQVRYFESWNEPNLESYLAPQKRHGKLVSPELYRQMLKSLAAGVKSVNPDNKIVGPSTGPFGGPTPNPHARPVRFMRDLLCLKGRKALQPTKCPRDKRVLIDIFSHHPIAMPEQGPDYNAINPDDASSGDLDRVRRVLRAAERAGTITPAGRRPLWATEYWWPSDPPAAGAPSQIKQARLVAQSLYVFWRDGAQAAFYFDLIDSTAQGPGWGLVAKNFKPKPSYRALKFPFVTRRIGPAAISAWGMAPGTGNIVIQRMKGGAWRNVDRVHVGPSRVFTAKLRLRRSARLRAVLDQQQSLVWKQR